MNVNFSQSVPAVNDEVMTGFFYIKKLSGGLKTQNASGLPTGPLWTICSECVWLTSLVFSYFVLLFACFSTFSSLSHLLVYFLKLMSVSLLGKLLMTHPALDRFLSNQRISTMRMPRPYFH